MPPSTLGMCLASTYVRRPGRDTKRPPGVAGSHIDTQPSGGKFDGNYGVLAGLEVVRTLNDRRIATVAPVEVAVWTNEEGTGFTPVEWNAEKTERVRPRCVAAPEARGKEFAQIGVDRFNHAMRAVGRRGHDGHAPGRHRLIALIGQLDAAHGTRDQPVRDHGQG